MRTRLGRCSSCAAHYSREPISLTRAIAKSFRPLLSHFQTNLNYVSTLVCIGYGFGDDHINQVIRRWLEFANARKIEIVCPGIKNIPAFLHHLTTQVVLMDSSATDYLDHVAGIVRNRREILEKRY